MDNTKKVVRPNPPVPMNAELEAELRTLVDDSKRYMDEIDEDLLIMKLKSFVTRYGAKLHNLGYTTAEKEMEQRK